MRRLSLLFVFAWLAELAAGKVYYLDAAAGDVPPGKVCAVEARCRMKSARMGRRAQWSLRWDDNVAVTLAFDSRGAIDGVSDPLVTVSCGDRSVTLAAGEDFDCGGGWNTLAVEWDAEGNATISGGSEIPVVLMSVDSLARPYGNVTVESAEVMDLIIETDDNDLTGLMTDCSPETLTPWRYLDRSGETHSLRPGGHYSLGLLETEGGYDLIYLSGAEINGRAWKPGMKKGELRSRGFQGHYLLRWVDATGRDLPGEHYATLDLMQGILTLVFPEADVTIRLSR